MAVERAAGGTSLIDVLDRVLDQGHANPRVDHDALVEYAIENVDETCAARSAFNCHALLLCLREGSPPLPSAAAPGHAASGGQCLDTFVQAPDFGAQILVLARQIAGGAGGQILGMLIPLLANSASTPDIGAIIGQVAGGGVAGAVLTAIVGAIKNRAAA